MNPPEPLTYRQAIINANTMLGQNPKVLFCGYNVKYGFAGGTLTGVFQKQLVELPVAENLMAGIAIGLSLKGYIPVLYFERFDFVLNAMDAIVNHLDKIEKLSNGEFKPKVLIRAVVGNRSKPLFTGSPHVQNFSTAFRNIVSFPIIEMRTPQSVIDGYGRFSDYVSTTMLVEFKDLM